MFTIIKALDRPSTRQPIYSKGYKPYNIIHYTRKSQIVLGRSIVVVIAIATRRGGLYSTTEAIINRGITTKRV
jgi:hypothetical protein